MKISRAALSLILAASCDSETYEVRPQGVPGARSYQGQAEPQSSGADPKCSHENAAMRALLLPGECDSLRIDVGEIWDKVLRDAEEDGTLPTLTAWQAETFDAFCEANDYTAEQIGTDEVQEQIRQFERARRRKYWWRWLLLRRKTVRLSDLE